MFPMLISVIIPTYKPQSYIWDCLNSLKNQSFDKSKFEIVIILNGCKEPYESLIQSFINDNLKGHNVIFLQVDEGGVSNARNLALDIVTGEYITFLDDDDFLSPSFLQEMYNKADIETVALSNTLTVRESDRKIWDCSYLVSDTFKRKCHGGRQLFYKARKYFSGPVMKLIHKDIIGNRRFNPKFSVGEDSQFMFLISDRIKYVDFTSENAIYYRRLRDGSAVTSLSYKQKLINVTKMIPSYSTVFIKGFPHYNVYFFITRILGSLHSLI